MDEATRKLVRLRAGDRCEYCLHRQEDAETTHLLHSRLRHQKNCRRSPVGAQP